MAPPQKGKQGTRGTKQILEENVSTLKFYRYMGLGSLSLFYIANYIFFEFTTFITAMSTLSVTILFSGYQFMTFMAKPRTTDSGEVIDAGTDLNMEGGIAEHVKDLIILSSGALLLSLVSNYFWLILILAPVRAIWMLWGSLIKPWLNQPAEETEVDDKKQKKMERRMKRMR